MSSKHIKALGLDKSNHALQKHVESDEEDEEERGVTTSSAFLAFGDSDSSDTSPSSGDDDDDNNNCESSFGCESETPIVEESNISIKSKVANTQKQNNNTTSAADDPDDDDMQYLNSFLEASLSTEEHANTSQRYQFLHTERQNLDIDGIMRRRFGGSSLHTNDDEDEEHNNNPRNNTRNKTKHTRNRRIMTNQLKKTGTLSHKRLLFGSPKEDWPRPLSFINGGICMKQLKRESPLCSMVSFEFQWSTDYLHLQEEFHRIQSSSDCNQLCLFISHHPHHTEALLQLAMVFARTGQMDRATDLIRRSLYYLEQTHIEPFKPYEYPCFIDITREENKSYFFTLFRHMQISGMLGCPKVASSIGKYILSLDVLHDPVHTLLFLDHYFLASSNHAEMMIFCTASTGEILLHGGLYDEACPTNSGGDEDIKDTKDTKDDTTSSSAHICTTGDLMSVNPQTLSEVFPNWAYSLALSHHNHEESIGTKHLKPQSAHVLSPTITTYSPSQELLITACRRFPFLLVMSLSEAMKEDTMRRNWKVLLEHPFFVAFGSEAR